MRYLACIALVAGCHDFDALTCGDSLLGNGTFEGPSTFGWSPFNASLSTTTDAHGGSAAAHVCQTSGSYFTLEAKPDLADVPSPGDRLRVTAFVRAAAGQVVRLYFREHSAEGIAAGKITATGQWQRLDGSHTIETEPTSFDFYISADPASGTDCLDIDDVCFVSTNASR